MSLVVLFLVASLVCYLIGGIPFGMLVAWCHGIDIRSVGSGNIGAANVGRALGRNWGIAVFFMDMLKGLVPMLGVGFVIGSMFDVNPFEQSFAGCVWLASGMFSVLGHNYSPFIGFKGGKGVATSLGVGLGVYPDFLLPALAALGTYLLVIGIWRLSSLGSMSGSVVFPVFYVVVTLWRYGEIGSRWPFVCFSILAMVMVLLRHHANIGRLLRGTEARLWGPQPGSSDDESQTRGSSPETEQTGP